MSSDLQRLRRWCLERACRFERQAQLDGDRPSSDFLLSEVYGIRQVAKEIARRIAKTGVRK